MNRRLFTQLFASLGLASSLVAPSAFAADPATIKVGVTVGPHAQILEEVKKVAAKDGLNIQIIEFSDYIQPNAALAAGDLNANSYQHKPFLDVQIHDRGYKFTPVANTITLPMAIYSKKIKSLNDIPQGATIGIPNDPTNGGRALLILQEKGVFKLRKDAGLAATSLDITDNPKKVKIVALDAAQLPRSIDDFTLAVINTNFATSAGLSFEKDTIGVESAKGPYVNVIAVRTADKEQPWVAKFVKAYHSQEVKDFIQKTFKGSVIASW